MYAFAIAILLPLDWFAPTGHLLHEFGAKPATALLTLGGMAGFALLPPRRLSPSLIERSAVLFFAAWLALGFTAALLNFIMGWSTWNDLRTPVTQLVNQSSLVVCCAIAIIGNARLARAHPIAELLGRYVPLATVFQLTIFALEAFGALSSSSLPLSLFRAVEREGFNRPSGLFSEPSYFGTFAALYGSSLLCLPARGTKRLAYIALAATLYVSSVLIGAKTFVVVIAMQVAYFVSRWARSLGTRAAAFGLIGAVAACAVFFIQRYSALNVQSNLSSAERLGSSLLATNVAARGYSLPGIGFGQFHFFYRDEFAPAFLYLSSEASLQLTPDAPNRASTYNFYLRVLLETGAAGAILLVVALRRLWRVALPDEHSYVEMLFAGALGFLFTQDTYFYPPLVVATALIMAAAPRASERGARSEAPTGHRMAGA
ncbi:MAG: hypothetical protein ACREUT_06795 [Steroidobacteraceae bacterium]